MKEFFDDHSNLIIEVDIGEGNKKYRKISQGKGLGLGTRARTRIRTWN